MVETTVIVAQQPVPDAVNWNAGHANKAGTTGGIRVQVVQIRVAVRTVRRAKVLTKKITASVVIFADFASASNTAFRAMRVHSSPAEFMIMIANNADSVTKLCVRNATLAV